MCDLVHNPSEITISIHYVHIYIRIKLNSKNVTHSVKNEI